MEFNDLEIEKAYRVLAPRPTIIVTTANSKGESNAAPFSFTMPVSVKPALVAFASVPSHHTYKNIEETGEFVVNIPNEAILEKLWITGEKFPYGVSEIEESGLTQMESLKVSPPKIAECIAHMECKVHWIRDSGDHKLIVGEIIHADAASDALKEGLLDVERMKPVMHLGGVNFVVGDHLRRVE